TTNTGGGGSGGGAGGGGGGGAPAGPPELCTDYRRSTAKERATIKKKGVTGGIGGIGMTEMVLRLSIAGVGGKTNTLESGRPWRVGLAESAIGSPERVAWLESLFPHVKFELIPEAWADRAAGEFETLIVSADIASLDNTIRWLRGRRPTTQVVVVLREADVI